MESPDVSSFLETTIPGATDAPVLETPGSHSPDAQQILDEIGLTTPPHSPSCPADRVPDLPSPVPGPSTGIPGSSESATPEAVKVTGAVAVTPPPPVFEPLFDLVPPSTSAEGGDRTVPFLSKIWLLSEVTSWPSLAAQVAS